MIQYEQGSLQWRGNLPSGKLLMTLVRNFSIWYKFNYLHTHRVHHNSFTLSQELFFYSIQISSEVLLFSFHDFISNVMKDCS